MSEREEGHHEREVQKELDERGRALAGALAVYERLQEVMVNFAAASGDIVEEWTTPQFRMQADPRGKTYRIEPHPNTVLHTDHLEAIVAVVNGNEKASLTYKQDWGLRIEVRA